MTDEENCMSAGEICRAHLEAGRVSEYAAAGPGLPA
jgi:hypothetical protein